MSDARLGLVTGRTTAANRGEGGAVRLLQAVVTDIDDVRTVQLAEQMGEESNPPDGTWLVILPTAQAAPVAVAAHDGIEPVLEVGGKRIYSIKPADHTVIAEVRLDPDGKITATSPEATLTMHPSGQVVIANAAASITMNANGTFLFHGVSATFDCPVTAPSLALTTAGGGSGSATLQGSLTATVDVTGGGKSLKNHVHPENDNGGPTGAPV